MTNLEQAYKHRTARELAAMHGITHAAMRQRLSRACIPSPRRDAVKARRSLLSRLWHRGSAAEIAQYLEVPRYTVRRDARILSLPVDPWQMDLFNGLA